MPDSDSCSQIGIYVGLTSAVSSRDRCTSDVSASQVCTSSKRPYIFH